MRLYEIANEYRQAFDALSGMELSPEIIADSISAIGGQFEDKAKAVAVYIKELNAESLAIENEALILSDRARNRREKSEKLKGYLIKNMQDVGIDKLTDPIHPVSIRKNPPKLIIDDIDLLKKYLHYNDNFWEIIPPVAEQKVLINSRVKEALATQASKTKDELKDDERIQGAHLEQGVRLDFN